MYILMNPENLDLQTNISNFLVFFSCLSLCIVFNFVFIFFLLSKEIHTSKVSNAFSFDHNPELNSVSEKYFYMQSLIQVKVQ